jgi:hypothetical protein
MTRQQAIGKWGKATYALKKTTEDGSHRGHRGHRAETQTYEHGNGATGHAAGGSDDPMAPMTPMTSSAAKQTALEQPEPPGWRMRI